MAEVIETTGEVIGDESVGPTPNTAVRDVPVYTVARAVEWMKRPENAARIEQFAQDARAVQDDIVRSIDREVTKVFRLGVQLATDDDVLEDFTNSLLGSLIGED